MDGLLASAYVLLGALMGYMIGLLVRHSFVEGSPGGGGQAVPTSPVGWGPDDWAEWERELTGSFAHTT